MTMIVSLIFPSPRVCDMHLLCVRDMSIVYDVSLVFYDGYVHGCNNNNCVMCL